MSAGACTGEAQWSGPVTPANWVVCDADYLRAPVSLVGGKARGLGAILDRKAPCPPSFCVTTTALRECVAALTGGTHVLGDVPEIVRDLDAPARLDEEIRAHLRALPGYTGGPMRLAVRSSFVSEDSRHAMSPGIYLSEIGTCTPEEVTAAVLRVWASGYTPEALEYRRAHGMPLFELGMAVVVQHAPTPVAGGVAYTVLPGTDDATAVFIEYADGSPAGVVDNLVAVRTCVVGKRTRAVPDLGPGLFGQAHASELVRYSLDLERAHDAPLDLEWLVDEQNELWLLQAREVPYPALSTLANRYVDDARRTTLRSPKLTPFRIAATEQVRTVPASLILPAAFIEFRRCGDVATPALLEDCRAACLPYVERGPVSLRSVYWSALHSGDQMPQSGLLTTVDDCVEHIQAFWRFVRDRGLDDYTAEVALLVCNWTDLRASVIATVPADSSTATVAALYGQLGGLESCAHDVYEVDLGDYNARRELVPDKPEAVLTPGQPPEPVAAEARTARVLNAAEITAVGRNLAAIRRAQGAARVELLVLNEHDSATEADLVVTWQVSPLSPAEVALRYYRVKPGTGGEVSGRVFAVRDLADVRALDDESDGRLVYVDFAHAGSRDPALGVALASALRKSGCPVLLRGSLLSHLAALLRDYGVPVYPVVESLDALAGTSVVMVEPVG